jgi:hypothetical protein
MGAFKSKCAGHTDKCKFCGTDEEMDTYTPDDKSYCCKACYQNSKYRGKMKGWGKYDESITRTEQ